MTPLSVPPQDRADYDKLITFLERVQVGTQEQAAARAALMQKLQRYDDPRQQFGTTRRQCHVD